MGVSGAEARRLESLRALDVLDTSEEQSFDRITRVARTVTSSPMSFVTLVDEDRLWFKSMQGFVAREVPRGGSLCEAAILSSSPLVVADATRDPRFVDSPYVTGETGLRAYLGIPLIARDGERVGTLCACDTVPREFTDGQVEAMRDLAGLVVESLEMRTLATTDSLTRALNRRAVFDLFGKEFSRARRDGASLACAVVDLDHFKAVNDGHGHAVGDMALSLAAKACMSALRDGDVLGRMGGEEFVAVLRDAGPAEAVAAGERLRAAVASVALDGGTLRLSASVGVATVTSRDLTHADLLARADAATYAAKDRGRDRVVLAGAVPDAACA